MVTTLTGSNGFALKQRLTAITHKFISEHDDLALERLDGEEATLEQISDALNSLPFLASNKLVVLRAPGVIKEFQEKAEDLLSDIPEITNVLIVEPKLDKRLRYYKWLKKHTEFQEFNELDERQLSKWAVDYVKEQGGKLSLADAAYLIGRVGARQQRLGNELQKLLLADEINREVIDGLTEATPQSKVFDLLDAAFRGQAKRAMELYQEQRKLRVEPQEIMAMLGWQLRQACLAKTAGKHDLVREGKVSPYSASKASTIASRLTLTRLKQLVYDLTMLDAKSKRVSVDMDEALQNYILALST